MKIFSILVCITIVGIAVEICKAKYLLVEINDAEKTGNVSRLNHTVDLLKERKVADHAKNAKSDENNCVSWRQTSSCSPNGNREPINDKSCNETVPNDVSGFCECREGVRTMPKWCNKGKFLNCNDACNIEWLTFMHVKREMYIRKPEIWNFPPKWDAGNIHEQSAGKHMITDRHGNPLKLSEVKHGMKVKIVAKDIHFEGYQYLYATRGLNGNCYYDQFRDFAIGIPLEGIWTKQQTWIVKIDYSNSDRNGSFSFENNYWWNKLFPNHLNGGYTLTTTKTLGGGYIVLNSLSVFSHNEQERGITCNRY